MGKWREQFRRVKDARHLSARELADISGVPEGSVENYLTRSEIPISAAIKIADALGLSLDEVFRPDVEPETIRVLERLLKDAKDRLGRARPRDFAADAKRLVDGAHRDSLATDRPATKQNEGRKDADND